MVIEIIILLAIIIGVVLMILILINKRKKQYQKELLEKSKEEEVVKKVSFDKRIETPRESLLSLNKIAREFFREYLKNKNSENYSEIEEQLKKKKEKSMVDFCESMNFLLYSKREISKQEALDMIEKFNSIIK